MLFVERNGFGNDVEYIIRTYSNGSIEKIPRFKNGKLHRLDGPAHISTDASIKEWYFEGNLHRDDGPATETNTANFWYQHNEIHRVNRPAVEYADGCMMWYQNDKLHRLDGPAIYRPNERCSWYVDDIRINCNSQEEFERLLKLKPFW